MIRMGATVPLVFSTSSGPLGSEPVRGTLDRIRNAGEGDAPQIALDRCLRARPRPR